MEAKTHWEQIYHTKAATQVSWYQLHPLLSLQYIQNTGISKTGDILDVGGGASTLVDHLLDDGFQRVTVLDISATALEVAQRRLGPRAGSVTWLEADITKATLPHHQYDIWHDRAVFHFLTQAEDRQHYLNAVREAVKPGGYVIVATFADDGPERCSGLEVVRYSPESLHNEFGAGFELLDSAHEQHQTPFETEQKFIYCYCRVASPKLHED
jgi:2-polyprenyl-3-methyl-5-hydroxy-6-metoxy-1,4-benzoquinol methylase